MKNLYSFVQSTIVTIASHLVFLATGTGQATWSGTIKFDPTSDGGVITDAGDAGSYTGSKISASYTIGGHTLTGSSSSGSNPQGVGIEDFETNYTGVHNMMWFGHDPDHTETFTLKFSGNERFDLSQLVFISTSDQAANFSYTITGYSGSNVISTVTTNPLVFDAVNTITLNFTGIDRVEVVKASGNSNGISFQIDDLVLSNVGQVALPIKLSSFSATVVGQKAKLQWQITDAVNFSHFIVERSMDGNLFEIAGEIKYKEDQKSYSYEETNTGKAESKKYYRLKMQDIDGTYSYSKIIPVKFQQEKLQVGFYPNPVQEELKIHITEKETKLAQVTLLTRAGRTIMKKEVRVENGEAVLRLTNDVRPDQYIIVVETESGKQTGQIIKK